MSRQRKTIDRSELENIALSQIRRLPNRVKLKDVKFQLSNGITQTGVTVDTNGVRWATLALSGSFRFSLSYDKQKKARRKAIA